MIDTEYSTLPHFMLTECQKKLLKSVNEIYLIPENHIEESFSYGMTIIQT